MKTKHGVFVKYGQTSFRLSANELELMADALEIINPDTEKQIEQADKLANSFRALAEYARSVGLMKTTFNVGDRVSLIGNDDHGEVIMTHLDANGVPLIGQEHYTGCASHRA